jgi:hypothetical protein
MSNVQTASPSRLFGDPEVLDAVLPVGSNFAIQA